MATLPGLPLKFPCWCQAVYSWGGETKKDLGFVEGDLIECLNAGDGSWWMGRLFRDRRAMGHFPSNFVKLLDENFTPTRSSRNASPLAADTPVPQKTKSVFRKPFQAYSAPNPELNRSAQPSPIPSRQNNHLQTSSNTPSRQDSYLQSSSNTPSRQGSYLQNGSGPPSRRDSYLQSSSSTPSRQHSYLQSGSQLPSRQNSYLQNNSQLPSRQNSYLQHTQPVSSNHSSAHGSRAPSPGPPGPPVHYYGSRQPSPNPYQEQESSPPPPPPPPHRIAYNQAPPRTPSPAHSMNERFPVISRGHSPMPHSPAGHGHTPSPLRDAMEDVMSSLQDMQMRRNEPTPPPEPLDPWSPEAFDELRTNPRRQKVQRPQTSLGVGLSQQQDYIRDDGYNVNPRQMYEDGVDQPVISNYVDRMEQRLRNMKNEPQYLNDYAQESQEMPPPALPPKASAYHGRPMSSMDTRDVGPVPPQKLHNRKSAYELRDKINRTFTTKSTLTNASSGTQSTQATNSSSSTQATQQSIMSGQSAGGFSATSAGSFARRKGWGSFRKPRPQSVAGVRNEDMTRPETPLTGISYHSSHDSHRPASAVPPEWAGSVVESGSGLGGLTQAQGGPMLKPKKSGFLRKLVETAKTGAASARSSVAGGQPVSRSPVKSLLPNGVSAIAGGGSSAARDMGLGGGSAPGSSIDWVQIRRDVNRSNSLSRIERQERADRCQMIGHPVVDAVDLLEDAAEGDEGIDGMPISEPTNFQTVNLQLVDKSARFIASLPPMTNPTSLAQGYVCRPYRSDIQRFRAIFTWVSEKVAWEEDFEGQVDPRRVIQTRRGCAEEVAVLTMEMCQAVGLHAEVVHGYLKPPGELPDLHTDPRPNHWWNAILVDGEWRIMDCSLASPTNPKRSLYSSAPSAVAESFYFLMRPLEACFTHIPTDPPQQHIVPPVDPSILLALPCVMPPYFRNGLKMQSYSTALLFLDGLELMHIHVAVPSDVEIHAEVSARTFARDADGDLFESGDQTVKRALAQAEWKNGVKRYTIKAALPSDEGHGMLNIYAGKRGLMHSIKDNPHPLAIALPIYHAGPNPTFDFLKRHPTPHAQRHDLYVSQPQCQTLACNNTFVFSVRQHPSSLGQSCPSPPLGGIATPGSIPRPASALSMVSASSSNPSNPSSYFQPQNGSNIGQPQAYKPAKLAVQAPSGKILRLSRKVEGGFIEEGGTWETIIKVGERGVWRGLVLADRSARWCVWGEWECI